MQPITFTSQCYWLDGEPVYLLSGEFHYFRVPRADWRRRMRLFKEAGGNCLATYVPWLIHEPVEGDFRFSGADWLDLEGFLQMANEEGLYVVARPGPYQYSELIYNGLPGWLIQNYPEVLALTARGKRIGYASISYTQPLFMDKVRRWFAAVCPILARYTISRGGPILYTQIDNEMVGIHEWFGSLDYHPQSMGIGQPGGAYPEFLKARFGSLDALNQAYGTRYAAYEDVRPGLDLEPEGAPRIRSKKDYFDFYLGSIADYAQFLVGLMRAHGIDTPIMHNSGNPGMNAYFEATASRLGDQFLLGSDHYYNLDQNWPQNNPTPQYAARAFISLEMLRLMGYPPSVLELPGGSASDWPPVTPDDALACYLTNLAFGMKGSNYYIFTGGPNPPATGSSTDLYDFGAAIAADGTVRPLYAAQQAFGAVIRSHPGWLTARRLCDFRLGMDLEYARSEKYWDAGDATVFSSPEAWLFQRRGLVTTALCASLSPEFVDLRGEDWTTDTRTPLVIVASASMARDKQQRLVTFLQHGGRLMVAPILPYLDDDLNPCTLLADALGAPKQILSSAGIARPRIGVVTNVIGAAYPFTSLPAGAEVFGVDEFTSQPIAARFNLPGGGQALILGLSWNQAMREHELMLRGVLGMLGVVPAVSCANPNLWVSAYVEERAASERAASERTATESAAATVTLFVMNLFTAPAQAAVRLQVGDQTLDAGIVSVPGISVKVLDLPF